MLEQSELEQLIVSGLTVAEIARQVDRSPASVRYWLARYGLKTTTDARLKAQASRPAARVVRRECRRHGEVDHVVERSGHVRCKQCRVDAVTNRRRRVKQLLVQEAGGCCRLCGYDAFVGALHFHHLDPSEKRLGVSLGGVTLALDFLREEAQKCVLLCSNCHAEVEGGIRELPIDFCNAVRESGKSR